MKHYANHVDLFFDQYIKPATDISQAYQQYRQICEVLAIKHGTTDIEGLEPGRFYPGDKTVEYNTVDTEDGPKEVVELIPPINRSGVERPAGTGRNALEYPKRSVLGKSPSTQSG